MPVTPDYIRILSEASERSDVDPDIARARARLRRAPRTAIWSVIRRWLAPAAAPVEGMPSMPALRDYPWPPPDRA